MIYLPRFAEPWMLVLLLLVPLSLYLGRGVQSLSGGRKVLTLFLRTLILLCLIAALAGMEILKKNDRLAVFFLLDQSSSVPEDIRLAAVQWVRNYCETYMTEKDEAGVIVFGKEASIELSVEPRLGLRGISSYVDGNQTNLAGAIRLAMAAFPEGYMRRIVAFSDGNETLGQALEEAKAARAEGVEVNVVPLQIGGRQEVRIQEVSAPSQTKTDEPFQLRIVARAEQESAGTLQVYQRVGNQRRMMAPQPVQLQKGDNVFLLSQELGQAGFYEYEVGIETEADTFSQNNEGRAFTTVHGEPQVLFVQGSAGAGSHLQDALRAEGLQVIESNPAALPTSLAQLQSYDAVVLSDVSAADLGGSQLELLEAMVRDLGIGLVMVGGPNSFGAGGYLDTAVERALPVDMDIKQRKILPRGALAVIMHTCEIPSGNVWAREIALAALNVLSAQDLMGTLAYNWQGGDGWLYELQPVGDKSMMRDTIVRGSQNIGDMPAVEPTLRMAYNALSKADAAVKRVVLISDGDPAAPGQALLNLISDAKISVSTVCIAPHSMSDQEMLKSLASITGGNYYYVNDAQKLPQIFSKEAAVVKRGVLVEEEFVPRPQHSSELLTGLGELPSLLGYVVTSPKENATVPLVSHEGDPVLAHWRYGLGKAVAFTSDATSRWAVHWLGWPGFSRYWSQSVRWALRASEPTEVRVETRREGGMGRLRIDAIDASGAFINFLRPQGVVTTPEFEQRPLEIVQTGPGVYEAVFPAEDPGVYMLNLVYTKEDGGSGMVSTGLAVDYSEEYLYNVTNLPLLEEVALAGGGAVLDAAANPFDHTLTATATVTPVWQYLLAAAVCLLPLEIFFRRVMLPYTMVWYALLRLLRRVPLIGRRLPAPPEGQMILTGRYFAYGSGGAAKPRQVRAAQEQRAREFGAGSSPVAVDLPLEEAPPAESFGAVRAPETEAQDKREPGTAQTDYTQKLFEAKQRAKTQRKKDDTP